MLPNTKYTLKLSLLSKGIFCWIVLLLLSNTSCTLFKKSANTTISPIDYQFPYDLGQPDVTFELDKSLKEVSGIAFTKGEKEIVAVQDEEGILFYLDKNTGKILRQQRFHKDGDYEDIEVVDEDIYVIKSNGSLYELKKTEVDTFTRTKYKISTNKDHDIEGLSLDKKNNRLLVAYKGLLSTKESYKLHKGLYAFNLSTMQLEEEPVFSISLEAIENYIQEKGAPEMKEDFQKIITVNDGILGFAPSAVAIHPITENIYITSSKGKTLAIISQKNKLLHLQKLDKKIHPQPEGILFDSKGVLYISNEGKEGNARIHKFIPKVK